MSWSDHMSPEVLAYLDARFAGQQQASKDDVPESVAKEVLAKMAGLIAACDGRVYEAFARYIAAHEQASKDAPRLLTEREWRTMLTEHVFNMREPELRERGLILPEPVDALANLLRDAHETVPGFVDLEEEIAIVAAHLRARLPGIDELARGVTLDCGGE